MVSIWEGTPSRVATSASRIELRMFNTQAGELSKDLISHCFEHSTLIIVFKRYYQLVITLL